MTDETKAAVKAVSGVNKLPPWLAARYRSQRHLEALVKIARILRGVGMTWESLHRATEEPRDGVEYEAVALRAMIETLDRAQPWAPGSSASSFVATLHGLAYGEGRVVLSSKQADWLEILLARAKQMIERAPAVEAAPDVADNVVSLRPRRPVS